MKLNTITNPGKVKPVVYSSSRTQQHFLPTTNINSIMDRYRKTGQIPIMGQKPQYGDFSKVTDYREALEKVNAANNAFNAFPARLRARFRNDPAEFIAFVSDENNRVEAIELGLIPKPEIQPVIVEKATNQAVNTQSVQS